MCSVCLHMFTFCYFRVLRESTIEILAPESSHIITTDGRVEHLANTRERQRFFRVKYPFSGIHPEDVLGLQVGRIRVGSVGYQHMQSLRGLGTHPREDYCRK